MAISTTPDRKDSAPGFLQVLRLRGANYYRVGRLIVMDSLWRFRKWLAVYLAASAVAIAMQAGSLGIFITYAGYLESGARLTVGDYTFDATNSYLLLVAVIAGGGILLVAASFLKLFADRGFYDLGQRYGVLCSERLIAAVSSALHASRWARVSLTQSQFRQMAIGGSQICARALYGLMSMLPRVAELIVYFVFLIYLDILLTALLLATLGLSSLFFYFLSVEAARHIPTRQERKREMHVEFEQLIDFLKCGAGPVGPGHPFLDTRVKQGTFSRYFRQFFRPRILNALSNHVGTIVQALALMLIALIKGGEIITTGKGFGDLVVFLLAGRMAMTAFLAVSRSLVMINRFYPRVSDYFGTLERLSRSGTEATVSSSETQWSALRIEAKPLAGDEEPPVINRGERIALVTPRSVDRFALLEVTSGLRPLDVNRRAVKGRLPPAQCWLVPEEPLSIQMSLLETTGLPDTLSTEALKRDLDRLGLGSTVLESLPANPGAVMEAADWERLHPLAFWGTSLYGAQLARTPVVTIAASVLEALKESCGESLERSLDESFLLIAYRPKDVITAGKFDERHVLLFDGDTLTGHLPIESVPEYAAFIQTIGTRKDSGSDGMDGDMLDEDM